MEDQNNGEKSEFIELAGLWKGKKPGVLTGRMGGGRLVVYPNRFKKEGSNEPDFRLSIVKQEHKPDDNQGGNRGGNQGGGFSGGGSSSPGW